MRKLHILGDTTGPVDTEAVRLLRALPFEGRLEILRMTSRVLGDTRAPSRRARTLARRFIRTQIVRDAVRRLYGRLYA